MRVFVAGATGVLGRASIPELIAAGHEVVGASRSEANEATLRELGATPVKTELFDAGSVRAATAGCEAICHLATKIPPIMKMRSARAWEENNRLRREATKNLVDGGIAGGATVFVQESITFIYGNRGDEWVDESAPTTSDWAPALDSTFDMEHEASRFAEGSERRAVILRFGLFYGPQAASTQDSAKMAKRRMLPVLGKGDNYFSNVHIDDAGRAVAAALGAPRGRLQRRRGRTCNATRVCECLQCSNRRAEVHARAALAGKVVHRRPGQLRPELDPGIERQVQGGDGLGAALPQRPRGVPAGRRGAGGNKMTRVLVTGGAGGLGSELVPRLKAAGYTVRVGSRKQAPADLEPGLEWAQMNLHPTEGLAEAVSGVDVVMHAASSPFKKTMETDVEGTKKLLAAAKDAGVDNFYYISIVGVDQFPNNPYYSAKWAAEQAIEASGVPYTIQRATQFHSLLDAFIRQLFKKGPLLLIPRAAKFQLIDTSEVAQHMVDTLAQGAAGRLEDIGGPEVLTAGAIADSWVKATGTRVLKVPVPAMGPLAPFAKGLNCCPDKKFGKITWYEWLDKNYG